MSTNTFDNSLFIVADPRFAAAAPRPFLTLSFYLGVSDARLDVRRARRTSTIRERDGPQQIFTPSKHSDQIRRGNNMNYVTDLSSPPKAKHRAKQCSQSGIVGHPTFVGVHLEEIPTRADLKAACRKEVAYEK